VADSSMQVEMEQHRNNSGDEEQHTEDKCDSQRKYVIVGWIAF
jgi:hypothetical protein